MIKKAFRFIPLLVVTIGVIAFIFYNAKVNKKFISSGFESVIIKRDNWQLRTTEFYLENGLKVDSNHVNNFDLRIGDSISKKANTGVFKVYRKDVSGKHQFYKKLNLDQTK